MVFALPYLLIPVFTETSTDVNDDFDTGVNKFAYYAEFGEFTISGTISDVEYNATQGIYYYYLDDSEYFITSKEKLGDEGDFVLIRVEVAQEPVTDYDYLAAIEKGTQFYYNIPGLIVLIIGAILLIVGLARKSPEERASKEKAIARKKALDKELDMLERELQTTMMPQPGMPIQYGMQPGMPPQQMPPGQMPPQQGMQPGMPSQQMPPGQMPPRPGMQPGMQPGMPQQQAGVPAGQRPPGQAPQPQPGMAPPQPGVPAGQQQQRPPQQRPTQV